MFYASPDGDQHLR